MAPTVVSIGPFFRPLLVAREDTTGRFRVSPYYRISSLSPEPSDTFEWTGRDTVSDGSPAALDQYSCWRLGYLDLLGFTELPIALERDGTERLLEGERELLRRQYSERVSTAQMARERHCTPEKVWRDTRRAMARLYDPDSIIASPWNSNITNALRRAGIETMSELRRMSDAELADVRHLGQKGRQAIRVVVPYEPMAFVGGAGNDGGR